MTADEHIIITLGKRIGDPTQLGRDDSDPTAYFVAETAEDLAKALAAIQALADPDEDAS
jgi:hypothetical protein